VATGHASKDKGLVRRALGRLLRELSAREQKWLIRIIMKELKAGLSQRFVFNSYHQDAEDLYNVKMSLEKVSIVVVMPLVLIRGQESMMCDMIWMSPQSHISFSATACFLWQVLKWPCFADEWFNNLLCT